MKRWFLAILILALFILPGLTLAESPAELILTIKLDRTSVDVSKGETITATWQASGGIAPYTYTYGWFLIDSSGGGGYEVEVGFNTSDTSDTFQPQFGISGYLSVKVTDKDGKIAYKQAPFSIAGETFDALDTWLQSSGNAFFNEQGKLQASCMWGISGGKPPYLVDVQFKYEAYGTAQTISYERQVKDSEGPQVDNTFLLPKFFQNGHFEVTFIDARGTEKVETAWVRMPSIQIVVSLDKTIISPGEEMKVSWEIFGGTPPYEIVVQSRYIENGVGQHGPDLYPEGNETMVPLPLSAYSFVEYFVEVTDSQGKEAYGYSNADIVTSSDLTCVVTTNVQSPSPGDVIKIGWSTEGSDVLYNSIITVSIFENGEFLHETRYWPSDTCMNYTIPELGDVIKIVIRGTTAGNVNFLGEKVLTLSRINSKPGDATNDGAIDILDLVAIIDYIVSGTEPAAKTSADANGDGTVDILDLVWIIDQIVGGS